MGSNVLVLILSTLLLALNPLPSLAVPLATWGAVDLTVDDFPSDATPFSRVHSVGTYISPSVAITMTAVNPDFTMTATAEHLLPPTWINSYSYELRPLASSVPQSPRSPFPAISSLAHYIPVSPLPDTILIIFQLIFGATIALCVILGLASCITRLEDRRLRRSSLSRLKIDVGEGLQVLVVKTRSSSTQPFQSPTKSALCSPGRKGSAGKNVRWAEEIAVSRGEEDVYVSRDPEDLLL